MFGLSERLSERLIQKVKSPIVEQNLKIWIISCYDCRACFNAAQEYAYDVEPLCEVKTYPQNVSQRRQKKDQATAVGINTHKNLVKFGLVVSRSVRQTRHIPNNTTCTSLCSRRRTNYPIFTARRRHAIGACYSRGKRCAYAWLSASIFYLMGTKNNRKT